jgi:hypothetical protein
MGSSRLNFTICFPYQNPFPSSFTQLLRSCKLQQRKGWDNRSLVRLWSDEATSATAGDEHEQHEHEKSARFFDDLWYSPNSATPQNVATDHFVLLWPAEAMSVATAATNISSMNANRVYVFLEDFRYSPNSTMPQNVLTSGNAWWTSIQEAVSIREAKKFPLLSKYLISC